MAEKEEQRFKQDMPLAFIPQESESCLVVLLVLDLLAVYERLRNLATYGIKFGKRPFSLQPGLDNRSKGLSVHDLHIVLPVVSVSGVIIPNFYSTGRTW